MSRIDDNLLERAIAGDHDAINKLLAQHLDTIYAVCWRVLKNGEDAADAAQDALVSITRGLPGFAQASTFKTWAYQIAFNCALKAFNSRKKRQSGLSHSLDDQDNESILVHSPYWEGPDHYSEAHAFEVALLRVPDEFRIVLLMRAMAQMSYEEIAHELSIPVGTVRSRVARGRAALLVILDNKNDDE